jgi:dCMP deaminase
MGRGQSSTSTNQITVSRGDTQQRAIYKSAMNAALNAASRSPDPSSQTGAAIIRNGVIILVDNNHFPEGIRDTKDRLEAPLKYSFLEHAERNAIFTAARQGISLAGSTLVGTWIPCADCARAIVGAGITTYVCPKEPGDSGNWTEGIANGETILREGGVEIIELEPSELGEVPSILRSGKPWLP